MSNALRACPGIASKIESLQAPCQARSRELPYKGSCDGGPFGTLDGGLVAFTDSGNVAVLSKAFEHAALALGGGKAERAPAISEVHQ